MLESGILPEGTLQLVAGGLGDMLDHLDCQDTVSFTGSANTALKLRAHPTLLANSVRFAAEQDSLNASILGPDALPGTPEFDLFIKEVQREMTTKAGQKCTAIRRIIVPQAQEETVIDALKSKLAKTVLGDPAAETTTMGALVSRDQRDDVRQKVAALQADAQIAVGNLEGFAVAGADADKGAFMAPLVLHFKVSIGQAAGRQRKLESDALAHSLTMD